MYIITNTNVVVLLKIYINIKIKTNHGRKRNEKKNNIDLLEERWTCWKVAAYSTFDHIQHYVTNTLHTLYYWLTFLSFKQLLRLQIICQVFDVTAILDTAYVSGHFVKYNMKLEIVTLLLKSFNNILSLGRILSLKRQNISSLQDIKNEESLWTRSNKIKPPRGYKHFVINTGESLQNFQLWEWWRQWVTVSSSRAQNKHVTVLCDIMIDELSIATLLLSS